MFSNEVSIGARHILENPLPAGAYSALDRGNIPSEDLGDDGEGYEDGGFNSNGNGRRRRRNGNGGGGGRRNRARTTVSLEGDGDVEIDEENMPLYKYVPCDDVEEIILELGNPCPQHLCFGCKYVGQNRAAKIPDNRLQEVFQTMADGIGVSWPPALAVEVSIKYEKVRTTINETRGDREPLPKWSPASTLNHWFHHTDDPEIMLWLHMFMMKWTINKIRASSLIRKSTLDGSLTHDKDQFAVMLQAMRMYYFLSSKEPRKLAFFYEGAMIDRSSVSNGGIYRKSRPVYNFFNNKKKRHRHANGAGFMA